MKAIVFILFCTFGAILAQDCKVDKVLICYYASWGVYRPGMGFIEVEDIDPTLCTHMVYTFAGLDVVQNSIVSLDPWVDLPGGNGKDSYRKFVQLKQSNPCLKTLLAIGGWNEKSLKYSVMAHDDASRKSFADRALRFIAQYEFDGLDFDWEYPADRGGIKEDKANFVLLLKELRTRFQPWGYMLTIAVSATKETIANGYDIPKIAELVDYVSIMAYDYTSSNSDHTGLLAPLETDDGSPCIAESVKQWLVGCPASKIVVGIPLYARIFKLKKDSKDTGIGAPTEPIDLGGNYTRELGFLSTYELLDKMENEEYKVTKKFGNNYATDGKYWLTYDDENTIKEKVSYVMKNNLAGVMLWSIDTDDFRGLYNDDDIAYPLVKAVKTALSGK